jgi:hypothetical protein
MKIKKYSSEKNGASFSTKAASYAALTGAFLAMAGQSEAQIIYTDVNPNDTVMSPGDDLYDFFPIDFDNDGVADVVIQQYTYNGNQVCWAGTFSMQTSVGGPIPLVNLANMAIGNLNVNGGNTYIYPYVLNQGDPISSGNPNWRSFNQAYPFVSEMTLNWRTSSQYGHWNGVDGFLGWQFITGSDIFYGWVEMDIDSAATRIIVKGYAYESNPGMPIFAGDIGVGTNNLHKSDGSYFLLSNNPAVRNKPSAVYFSSDKQQDYKLEIINNLGEVIRTQSGSAVVGNNPAIGLHLQDVAAGNYFIRLTLGDKVQHRKLTVAEN